MMTRAFVGWVGAATLTLVVGCSSEEPLVESIPLPEGKTVFALALDPAQTISKAPFPNDLYRGPNGIALAPLGDDPIVGKLARPTALAQLDAAIDGRPGFGFAQPIQFFASEPIDLASLEGRVHLVAMDGPEAGREVAVESWWSDEANALSFFPAPGDWLMPDSTYVLAIDAGVTTEQGSVVGATRSLAELLRSSRSDSYGTAWDRAEPLRLWVSEHGIPVVATVFHTEPSLPPLEAMLAGVAAAPLHAPSREVRYDTASKSFVEGGVFSGAALDELFGVAAAPFATNPGNWGTGERESAVKLSGSAYAGGTVRGRIGKVIFGSVTVPAFNMLDGGGSPKASRLVIENGTAVSTVDAMLPITVFLCEEHLTKPETLPVAIFTHGGTASRNNATPLAVMNCEAGVATIAADLPFHGGRSQLALVNGRVVPTRADALSELTGLKEGEPGFVPDGVGDPAGADITVGNLFGLNQNLDPAIIEANLMTISAELAALVRLVREGDWSDLHPGLGFDGDRLFLENLSFGTTFTTGFLALSDDWRLAMGSTPSGHILGANLTVAPSNASLATAVVKQMLGLVSTTETLNHGVYRDAIGGLYSWLAERGDSMAFAPYVLRHRKNASPRNILQTGDSWDETLSTPAQLRYNAALGLSVLTSDGWAIDPSVPGAETLSATTAASTTSANVIYDEVPHTAGIFYNAETCHAQLITPICKKRFEKQYPPIVELAPEDVKVSPSPICSIHAQGLVALDSLLAGATHATIVPPQGDCDTVYAP